MYRALENAPILILVPVTTECADTCVFRSWRERSSMSFLPLFLYLFILTMFCSQIPFSIVTVNIRFIPEK